MLTLVAAVLTYDFVRDMVDDLSVNCGRLSLKVRSETRVEKDMVASWYCVD